MPRRRAACAVLRALPSCRQSSGARADSMGCSTRAAGNAAPGSFQSGVGLIRGWVCSAGRVDIEVVGRGALTAVYGEGREDTRVDCGDSNNGFSLQFNWNELGEGTHTVRALADGEEFGRATVTVATLGQAFFRGAQGEFPIEPFPSVEKTSRLRWLESRQLFVLSNGGTPATGGSIRGRIPIGRPATRLLSKWDWADSGLGV